uniref:C-type lectin domain-containing protein n=1 Tax=Sinocyclocheilus anshuiensis TaxID=1608454 RepID=A0A671KUP2_9TELE
PVQSPLQSGSSQSPVQSPLQSGSSRGPLRSNRLVLLQLLRLILNSLCSSLIREHFYLSIPKNWTDAQSYCRKYYEDLATITSQEEQELLLQQAGNNVQVYKWIGLHRDTKNTNNWLWSDGNSVSFINWNEFQPNNVNGIQNCVMITGKWFDYFCASPLTFFCSKTKFILVKEKKTWEEALDNIRPTLKRLVPGSWSQVSGRSVPGQGGICEGWQ